MASRWPLHLAQSALGMALALVLAEGAFYVRDGGAFPHLNVYEADEELGTRLRPGATERVRYGDNPATEVRISAEGWRGDAWGPPAANEIVVVGDSQVFGLGVDEDQTAAAQLGFLRGVPVRNAGVPTYGPQEYEAVVARLLEERHPAHVILVLNFSNDAFELARRNRDRHVVWDGWAVRAETAPAGITSFPGRSVLFNRSHAVYALRRWLYDPPADALALPSEGTWDEVLAVAAAEAAERPPDAEAAAVAEEVRDAAKERRKIEAELADALARVDPEVARTDGDLALQAIRQRASVGDIVDDGGGVEPSRVIPVTAAFLRQGAALRRELEPRLRAWAAAHPDDPESAKITELLAAEEGLDTRLGALSSRVAGEIGAGSPLTPTVERVAAACRAAGAELLVVALPLDVQVSSEEWAKYGVEPVDMTATRALLTDLVRDSRALGARALDATDALAAAEPGAFLDGDLHMTPKGQAALAAAISTALDQPPPLRLPGPGLPAGRSRVPTADEWAIALENVVKGSSKNHCSTREVREWLRVSCTSNDKGRFGLPDEGVIAPRGIAVRSAPLEAMAHAEPGLTDLVVPLLADRDVDVDFVWADRAETLTVRWEGGKPKMAFVPAKVTTAGPTAEQRRLTACLVADRPAPTRRRWVDEEQDYQEVQRRFGAAERCAGLAAAAAPSAGPQAAAPPDPCAAFIACAQGTRAALPTCAEGEVNAGSAGFCFALCDAARPCAVGVCTDWQGAGVCL